MADTTTKTAGAGTPQATGRLPELLIIQSSLAATKSKDGQPHIKQRVYPFMRETDCTTLDGFFNALRQWVTDLETCVKTGKIRAQTPSGEVLEVPMKQHPFGANGTIDGQTLRELLRRSFSLLHNPELQEMLRAEFGKPEEQGPPKVRSTQRTIDPNALV